MGGTIYRNGTWEERVSHLVVGGDASLEEKPSEELTTYKLDAVGRRGEKKCKTEGTNILRSYFWNENAIQKLL